jgi:hypothetical protein
MSLEALVPTFALLEATLQATFLQIAKSKNIEQWGKMHLARPQHILANPPRSPALYPYGSILIFNILAQHRDCYPTA